MATVYQSSAGASNAKSITISMWVRAAVTNSPSADFYSLLEFGNPDGVWGGVSNYVQFQTNSTNRYISVQLGGVKDSVAATSVFSGSSDSAGDGTLRRPYVSDTTAGNPYNAFTDPTIFLTPYATGSTGDLGAVVDPGKWFHLLIAADFEFASSYASPTQNKLYILVNGAVCGVYGPDGSHEMTNGAMYSAARCEDGSGVADIVNSYIGGGPFTWASGIASGSGFVPSFEFDLNGFEIGIPYQRASTSKNTQLLDMADVQIWIGQYIDPTNSANFEKFINTVGGRKYPVSPYAAAIAFGPQTYLFTGAASSFITNRGTGGSFVKTGTLSDVSGPSI